MPAPAVSEEVSIPNLMAYIVEHMNEESVMLPRDHFHWDNVLSCIIPKEIAGISNRDQGSKVIQYLQDRALVAASRFSGTYRVTLQGLNVGRLHPEAIEEIEQHMAELLDPEVTKIVRPGIDIVGLLHAMQQSGKKGVSGIAFRDHQYRGVLYPCCFSGQEAVDWVVKHCPSSVRRLTNEEARTQAVFLLRWSLVNRHIRCISAGQKFQDKGTIFYRLTDRCICGGLNTELDLKRLLEQMTSYGVGGLPRKQLIPGTLQRGDGSALVCPGSDILDWICKYAVPKTLLQRFQGEFVCSHLFSTGTLVEVGRVGGGGGGGGGNHNTKRGKEEVGQHIFLGTPDRLYWFQEEKLKLILEGIPKTEQAEQQGRNELLLEEDYHHLLHLYYQEGVIRMYRETQEVLTDRRFLSQGNALYIKYTNKQQLLSLEEAENRARLEKHHTVLAVLQQQSNQFSSNVWTIKFKVSSLFTLEADELTRRHLLVARWCNQAQSLFVANTFMQKAFGAKAQTVGEENAAYEALVEQREVEICEAEGRKYIIYAEINQWAYCIVDALHEREEMIRAKLLKERAEEADLIFAQVELVMKAINIEHNIAMMFVAEEKARKQLLVKFQTAQTDLGFRLKLMHRGAMEIRHKCYGQSVVEDERHNRKRIIVFGQYLSKHMGLLLDECWWRLQTFKHQVEHLETIERPKVIKEWEISWLFMGLVERPEFKAREYLLLQQHIARTDIETRIQIRIRTIRSRLPQMRPKNIGLGTEWDALAAIDKRKLSWDIADQKLMSDVVLQVAMKSQQKIVQGNKQQSGIYDTAKAPLRPVDKPLFVSTNKQQIMLPPRTTTNTTSHHNHSKHQRFRPAKLKAAALHPIAAVGSANTPTTTGHTPTTAKTLPTLFSPTKSISGPDPLSRTPTSLQHSTNTFLAFAGSPLFSSSLRAVPPRTPTYGSASTFQKALPSWGITAKDMPTPAPVRARRALDALREGLLDPVDYNCTKSLKSASAHFSWPHPAVSVSPLKS